MQRNIPSAPFRLAHERPVQPAIVGQLLLALAQLLPLGPHPLAELGSTLFASGLIVVAFEYINERDADERANERLRKVLKEEAPAIRDAVIGGFAFAPDTLTSVASPDTLDRVIRNTLAIQLGDQALADDVYTDLRTQVLRTTEPHFDERLTITLAPWDKGPATGDGSMFVATIRREYRTRSLPPTLRLTCVSDLTEYRELQQDPTAGKAWYFEPVAGLDAASPEVFELLEVTIDDRPRPIRRSSRSGTQTYTAHLPNQDTEPDHDTRIAYTYRVLIQQHSHMLYLDFDTPAKGVEVELAYGDCGIRHVNVLDIIASSQRPGCHAARRTSSRRPSVCASTDGCCRGVGWDLCGCWGGRWKSGES